ncbi:retrotransposon gag protein [Cucumis melo var. makuwa]|uniref:Retrotransposon gag protein n=1 Tax=Cucumis melo var. makuwa TaxID=1194695 RepID=A0A5A7V621_CUCMM|nr:retrotransposon gag protein [Cucumis melo var. makuwa]
MIANSIRAQYGGQPQTSFMYSKPYTKRIDNLRMPLGTRHVINIMELTNTKQRIEEPVINYINRWRALSLNCKDKLTELSAVEMCTQDMLEQSIEKQLIQLPECKRPEQAGKVDDPNYCKYHRVISHPVEKCFVLKELIQKLACENKIELDIDEVAQTNHVAVNMTSSVLPSILLYDQRESLIQFGTFEHVLVRLQ